MAWLYCAAICLSSAAPTICSWMRVQEAGDGDGKEHNRCTPLVAATCRVVRGIGTGECQRFRAGSPCALDGLRRCGRWPAAAAPAAGAGPAGAARAGMAAGTSGRTDAAAGERVDRGGWPHLEAGIRQLGDARSTPTCARRCRARRCRQPRRPTCASRCGWGWCWSRSRSTPCVDVVGRCRPWSAGARQPGLATTGSPPRMAGSTALPPVARARRRSMRAGRTRPGRGRTRTARRSRAAT